MINFIKIILLIILLHGTIFAGTEYATFESFYVESSSIGWIIAAVFAAIAGAVIFFTGGTASPIVIGIGTWIGNTAGLSGIAATNYGLALLGGGSIATGGLGIAGGVAVLTATLTFSTEVIVGYTVDNVMNSYNYSNFVKDSKKMPTLPIPQNEDGSDNYKLIIEDLKSKIDENETLYSEYNQNVLLNNLKDNKLQNNTKDLSLLSYLHFSTSDYVAAKKMALLSIQYARSEDIKRTFPAFIVAVSSLYEEKFDFEDINKNYFRYSILAEPENKLISFMFSIYLDRILYRMNDDINLDYKTINSIRDIAFEIKDEDISNESLIVVMMRYFIKIKLEQQKILSLSKTDNNTIKYSDKTLSVVKKSLIEYKNLINSLSLIINHKPIQDHISEDKELKEINTTYAKYSESVNYLEILISNLRKEQVIYKEKLLEKKPWYKFW